MNLVKNYYYLFYKFYKFHECFKGVMRWSSDINSVITIYILEIFILFSVINYFKYLRIISPEDSILCFEIIPFVLITYWKWIYFWKTDDWKSYLEKFDKLSQNTNKKGTIITLVITLFSILNLVFSFYLLGVKW